MAVLFYAREKGLQFGRDIVFTYGPLGFLSINCFSPDCATLRIFFEIAAGIGIATGLCLVAWRLALPWRIAVIGFFIFLSCPLHWGGAALFLDLGLFTWALLCFLESGPRLRIFVSILAALAAAGALIKFTFLVTGLFTIGLLTGDLVLRRRRALAVGMLIGFFLAFLLGWLLLGQRLSGLGAYLSNSYAVASGYNAAMGSSVVNLAWVLIMTVAALAAVLIRALAFHASGTGPTAVRRGALALWLTGLLFMEWKYGCVRSDWGHVASALGVVTIIAICVEAVPTTTKRAIFWSRIAVFSCLIGALGSIQREVPGFALAKCVMLACHNMTGSLGVLAQPGWYLRENTEAFQVEQKKYQLPVARSVVGRATTDVFGQNQGFAILNELNYQPRPAFQSYTAYSRPMMELNEQLYLSQNAPEYVLFHLYALDGRFPPLEDSFVLRDALSNYGLVLREGDFLLLRRKGTAKAQLTLIKEGTIRLGEKLDLQNAPDPSLWLEMDLQPTLFGRLRRFLYKPQETQLVVWGQSEPPRIFRAPAGMLSAGFLANPLLLDTEDVMGLYTGAKVRRADAFSVVLAPDFLSDWQPQVHFRMYRIEKQVP